MSVRQPHVLRARLFVVAMLLLAFAPVGAQELHEILIGSIGDFSADEFECGQGRAGGKKECGLSYRYYAIDVPEEVNGPSLPLSGIPIYRAKKQAYLAHGAHTGNFPKAGRLGPGHVWHLLWDGVKNPETPAHVGYYAAMAQVVERGEMGNPLSRTCLPVTAQYACFGKMIAANGNRVSGAPVGDIENLGSLSPIPVPVLSRNGTDKVALVWEQAAGQVLLDGASPPILGYQLYLYPNPVNLPTQAELDKASVPVGDVIPLDTTFAEIQRSDPVLKNVVTFSTAIRLVYGGGLQSRHFSANGQSTGLAYPDTSATGKLDDASTGTGAVSRAIDIENLFLELRDTNTDYEKNSEKGDLVFHATVDLVGEPAGAFLPDTRVRLFIDFNDDGLADVFAEPGKKNTADITLEAKLTRTGSGPLNAEFTGLTGLGTLSRVDQKTGQVMFVAPLEALLGAVSSEKVRASDMGASRRRILVWAESSREKDVDRVPNTNDGNAPTVAGEVVKFVF